MTGTKYGVPSAQLNPATPYANYTTYNKLQTFIYDKVGNRQEFDDGANTYLYNRPAGGGAYTPSNVNEIYRIRLNGVDTSRTYDANGNLTNDGTFAYKWDYKNRLIEVDPAGGGAAVQTQNFTCLGARVFLTASSGTNYFYHGSPDTIETHDGTDTLQSTDVWAVGQWISRNIYGATYSPLANDRGSHALLTDASGNNVEKILYGTFLAPIVFDWLPIPGGFGWVSVPTSKYAPYMARQWENDSAIGDYSTSGRTYEPTTTGRFVMRKISDSLDNQYSVSTNPSNAPVQIAVDCECDPTSVHTFLADKERFQANTSTYPFAVYWRLGDYFGFPPGDIAGLIAMALDKARSGQVGGADLGSQEVTGGPGPGRTANVVLQTVAHCAYDKGKCPWSRSVFRDIHTEGNVQQADNGKLVNADEMGDKTLNQSAFLDLGGDALAVADFPGYRYDSTLNDEISMVTTYETCVASKGGVPPCKNHRCCSRYKVEIVIRHSPGGGRTSASGFPKASILKEWCD